MDSIVFYLSDHGFGHVSRNIPLIESFLQNTAGPSVLVKSGTAQNNYASRVLHDHPRLTCEPYTGDAGLPLREDGLHIDTGKLAAELHTWMSRMEYIVEEECSSILRHGRPAFIISDISPVGFLVSKALGVPGIGISNFTWSDQYEHLLDNNTALEQLRHAYSFCNLFYRYPFACACKGITARSESIGFISRGLQLERIGSIRSTYQKNEMPLVFVSLGRSCSTVSMSGDFIDNVITLSTEGVRIPGRNNVSIPLDTNDVHHFIAASDLVITKAGWSTITESIRHRTPMLILERQGILEDQTNTQWIKKHRIGDSIALSSLSRLSITDIDRIISLKENYENAHLNFEDPLLLTERILSMVKGHEEEIYT